MVNGESMAFTLGQNYQYFAPAEMKVFMNREKKINQCKETKENKVVVIARAFMSRKEKANNAL